MPLIIFRKLKTLKYWMKILNTQNYILKNVYDDMNSKQCENSYLFNGKRFTALCWF